MAYSSIMTTLCVSQPSSSPLFPGFGVKKVTEVDLIFVFQGGREPTGKFMTLITAEFARGTIGTEMSNQIFALAGCMYYSVNKIFSG